MVVNWISLKSICSVVVMAACLIVLSTSVEAKTNFAAKKAKPAIEESTALETETKAACCPDPAACHAQKKRSLGKRLADRITNFLAFGDKINHGLTDWILSDKSDTTGDVLLSP